MITKDMSVVDVLNLGEQYEEIFRKYLLTCAGCPAAQMETLEEAAEGHGIDIDALLADLNNAG
jgi:hybrid cluster-associated redox disulfide protein